jgi:hypothetical protein
MAVDLLNITTDGHLNSRGKTSLISLVTIGHILKIKVTEVPGKPGVFKIEPLSGLGGGLKRKELPIEEQIRIDEEEIFTIITMFLKYKEDGILF